MFASRLKSLRLENNLTQKELAKKLNMQNTAISKYELGEREPDIKTLNKLSEFFNVTLDYLLGRTDIKNQSEKIFNEHKEADEFLKRLKEEMIKEGIDFDETSAEELIETYKILKQFKEKTKSN